MEDYNNDIDDESVEGSSVGECYDSTGEGFESGENVECGDIVVGIEACKGDEIGNDCEISEIFEGGESVGAGFDEGDNVNSSIVNKNIFLNSSVIVNTEFCVDEIQENANRNLMVDESFEDDDWFDVDDEKVEDYVPTDDIYLSSEDDYEQPSFREHLENDRMLFVYESKLRQLLKFCPQCGNGLDGTLIEEVKNVGSQLHLKLNCLNGCNYEWRSQPEVESVKGLGNLFLSTGIVFSGLPFAKFERFAWLVNLKFISENTFYRIRKDFIAPVIRKMWRKERKRVLNALKERDLVMLIGDGR